MTDLSPFTVLKAFSDAEILCSMSLGPDGDKDSSDTDYQHVTAPNIDQFLDAVVKLAGESEDVVIEWRTLPYIGDHDLAVHGWLTMHEKHPQAPIAMKNQQR